MSNENYFSFSVYNSDMRNSLHSKLFVGNTLSISHVVVLNASPVLLLDMALDCRSILID